jgi:hypothetical protein
MYVYIYTYIFFFVEIFIQHIVLVYIKKFIGYMFPQQVPSSGRSDIYQHK